MASTWDVLPGEGYGAAYRRLVRNPIIRVALAGYLAGVAIALFLATLFHSEYWGAMFALGVVSLAIISLVPLLWKRGDVR